LSYSTGNASLSGVMYQVVGTDLTAGDQITLSAQLGTGTSYSVTCSYKMAISFLDDSGMVVRSYPAFVQGTTPAAGTWAPASVSLTITPDLAGKSIVAVFQSTQW